MVQAAESRRATTEEIRVTAQRNNGTEMSVPISLAALPSEELDRAGVQSTLDLPILAPSLQFSTNTALGQPYVRGVGSDLLTTGAESSVSTYVDDIYHARPAGSLLEFFDLERVEVLYGPQGTLFGRNATGGVIHVISKRPTDQLEAQSDLLYGNYNQVRLRAAVNAPLLDDKLRVRLAGMGNWRDGYSENLLDGRDVDDLNVGAFRGQIELRPFEDVTFLLRGDWRREHDSRNVVQKVVAPLAGSPAVVNLGGIVPADPREMLLDTHPAVQVESWGIAGRVEWSTALGELLSVSSYRRVAYRETLDLDGTQIPYLTNEPGERSDQFTQELRMSGANAWLNWIGGVFFLHESAGQSLRLVAPFASTDGLVQVPRARLRSKSVGVFAELVYPLAEDVVLRGGLRWTWDRREERYVETINGVTTADFDADAEWNALTPRGVLEWTPTDSTLLYGSVTRGYKAGGFNSVVAQEFPFDPEFVWAYEVGAKVGILENRVRLRGAGFFYDWRDIQLNLLNPALSELYPVVTNAGEAQGLGLELAGDAQPTEEALIQISLTLLDATFEDLTALDPNDQMASMDQSGNRLPRAPTVSLHAAIEYGFGLGDLGVVTPRVDYHYQSRVFYSVFEDPTVAQDGFGLLSVAARWTDTTGRYFVGGFARNLTNQLWAQSGVRLDNQIGNLVTWAAPRTYGLEVGGQF